MSKEEIKEVVDSYGYYITSDKLDCEQSIDLKTYRHREQEWIEMFRQWPSFMKSNLNKVKKYCRKGIPRSVRGCAWFYLSNAFERQQYENSQCSTGNLFQYYLTQTADSHQIMCIEKDIPRTFPNHELFRNNKCGQQSLYDVLKAYIIHQPDIGYVSGQSFIVAILLMHLSPEQTFWVFVQINDKYIKQYYTKDFMPIRIDALATHLLLERISPLGYNLLCKLDVDPILYMIEWYKILFTTTYGAPELYHIWDMFFCEGIIVLFRLALAILSETLEFGPSNIVSQVHQCHDPMELILLIKKSATELPFDILLTRMHKIPLTEIDLDNARQQAKQQLYFDTKTKS